LSIRDQSVQRTNTNTIRLYPLDEPGDHKRPKLIPHDIAKRYA
jgi:hypothetical protein